MPSAVHRRDGTIISQLAGRPAAIVTFLEGMWMRRPTATHCRAVGAALAAMHIAGDGFPLTRKNALSVNGWRPLWDAARPKADTVEPGLAGEVEADLRELEEKWPKDLPAGVCHADLFPDNVFFLSDKLSGLIDFYFACNDLFANGPVSVPERIVLLKRQCLQPHKRVGIAGWLPVYPQTFRDEIRRIAAVGAGLGFAFHADPAL